MLLIKRAQTHGHRLQVCIGGGWSIFEFAWRRKHLDDENIQRGQLVMEWYWHQFKICPCTVLAHDPEPSNDMLGHGSVVSSHLFNADEYLTAE
jgi:hypothetical protein